MVLVTNSVFALFHLWDRWCKADILYLKSLTLLKNHNFVGEFGLVCEMFCLFQQWVSLD